ncbi:hypothetical protein [Flavobacterium daejeonense]|uniref:hypothetical protein n=1 Tax=Flavobacterium daejeonense TaxID=350893 RepID=UPI00047D0D4F|nr:hypothetical protein [Flavobacterium daejeonense]
MGGLKDLADKIKAQQSGKQISNVADEKVVVVEKITPIENEKILKEKPQNEIIIKKSKTDEDVKIIKKIDALILKIKQSNKESKSVDNMIHTRTEEKAFKKLKILNAHGLSTQSIVSFLISDFLEKEEVKILIKQILENELE